MEEIIEAPVEGSESTEITEPSQSTDGYADAANNPEILAVFERVYGGKDEVDETSEPTEGEKPTESAVDEVEEGQDEPAVQPQPVVKAAKQEANKATLPASLLQAARRAGWTPEDATAFHAANPELAAKTFEKLHGTFNDLSQRYAALGQQRNQPPVAPWQRQQQQPAPQPEPAAPTNSLDKLFSELDKFAEANGEDITERFVKPLYQELVVPFRQMQAAYESQRMAAMKSEVSNTFQSFGKDYADLYGGKTLNADQNKARFEVAQLADQIRSGAGLQGQDITVSEALERAHALYTVGRQQQTIRQQITGKVQKRASSITARPSQRRSPGVEGKSDASAAAAVANFWNERGE